MRRLESLNTDNPPDDLCFFCYLPESRPVLYQDEHCYVIGTLGNFVEGYVLLVHQEHLDCYGDVDIDTVYEVKQRVRVAIEQKYGSCCFFEHGRTGNCATRGTQKICYHAHLHALPVAQSLAERLAQDFDPIEMTDWREIERLRAKHPHYLYYESPQGEMYFYPVDENVERQYLRKRACEAAEIPVERADWREYPMRENLQRTSSSLKNKI